MGQNESRVCGRQGWELGRAGRVDGGQTGGWSWEAGKAGAAPESGLRSVGGEVGRWRTCVASDIFQECRRGGPVLLLLILAQSLSLPWGGLQVRRLLEAGSSHACECPRSTHGVPGPAPTAVMCDPLQSMTTPADRAAHCTHFRDENTEAPVCTWPAQGPSLGVVELRLEPQGHFLPTDCSLLPWEVTHFRWASHG